MTSTVMSAGMLSRCLAYCMHTNIDVLMQKSSPIFFTGRSTSLSAQTLRTLSMLELLVSSSQQQEQKQEQHKQHRGRSRAEKASSASASASGAASSAHATRAPLESATSARSKRSTPSLGEKPSKKQERAVALGTYDASLEHEIYLASLEQP